MQVFLPLGLDWAVWMDLASSTKLCFIVSHWAHKINQRRNSQTTFTSLLATANMTEVEDARMQDLLTKWEVENNYEDDPEASDDEVDEDDLTYDTMLEKFRRSVDVTNNALDHVVLGTSNLEQALVSFEQETGVRPLMVVSHKGLGTKSARVAFEQCAFLEIIGPDSEQGSYPLAEKLSKIPEGQLVPIHYAVRNSKSKEYKNTTWKDMGLECDEVTMIAKDKGMPWQWNMFFMEGHHDAGLMPFFIDWGESHHAAGRLPIVGTLSGVKVSGPPSSKLHQLLAKVDGIDAETGSNHFEITFDCKNGKKTYSGSNLMGIAFPK